MVTVKRASMLAALCCLSFAALSETLRPLTPQDVLNLEVLGDWYGGGFEFSGTNEVTFVRQRPQVSGEYRRGVWDERRLRVWLASPVTGEAVDLAAGEAEEDGYWLPAWSPDDARLAMLSTRGGRQRLWLWERASGKLRPASSFDVARIAVLSYFWLDAGRLVAVAAPEAGTSERVKLQEAPRVAMREWQRAWTGMHATSSVLDSGAPVDYSARPQQKLAIVGVDGRERFVDTALGFHALKPAPGLKHFAYMKSVVARPPRSDRPARHFGGRLGTNFSGSRYEVAVMDREGAPLRLKSEGGFAAPNSFVWSQDGRRFAFIGVRGEEEEGPFRLFQGDLSGQVRETALRGLDPQAAVFAADGRLLVSAKTSEGAESRVDWWAISGDRPARNLTSHFKQPPPALYPGAAPVAIAVADGEVWRLDLKSLRWNLLSGDIAPKITGVVWPGDGKPRSAAARTDDSGHAHLIVATAAQDGPEYFRVDIPTAAVAPVDRPAGVAKFVAHSASDDSTLFVTESREGTALVRTGAAGRGTLARANAFLSGIAEGERRLIDYRGLDGQALQAQLILPVGYQPGRTYPLVTSVYAGSMVTDVNSGMGSIHAAHPLNTQLFAARGYAVLRPSMPLPPEPDGEDRPGSDPFLELTKGVLPAVDRAIELGIADPDRLAVTGQSFGGFSTYGLIAQTTRFRAAIAMAGPSDFVSGYGIFMADERHLPYPHETTFRQSLAETAQTRMGNPPWKDWSRYLRNSPLFYVDRVQTPVLITQGDLDYVSIQQGEEFFTALYRQGKRARFVRYWGEGHVIDSPANIVDFWEQIYRWLEEELAPRVTKPPVAEQ